MADCDSFKKQILIKRSSLAYFNRMSKKHTLEEIMFKLRPKEWKDTVKTISHYKATRAKTMGKKSLCLVNSNH